MEGLIAFDVEREELRRVVPINWEDEEDGQVAMKEAESEEEENGQVVLEKEESHEEDGQVVLEETKSQEEEDGQVVLEEAESQEEEDGQVKIGGEEANELEQPARGRHVPRADDEVSGDSDAFGDDAGAGTNLFDDEASYVAVERAANEAKAAGQEHQQGQGGMAVQDNASTSKMPSADLFSSPQQPALPTDVLHAPFNDDIGVLVGVERLSLDMMSTGGDNGNANFKSCCDDSSKPSYEDMDFLKKSLQKCSLQNSCRAPIGMNNGRYIRVPTTWAPDRHVSFTNWVATAFGFRIGNVGGAGGSFLMFSSDQGEEVLKRLLKGEELLNQFFGKSSDNCAAASGMTRESTGVLTVGGINVNPLRRANQSPSGTINEGIDANLREDTSPARLQKVRRQAK